MTADQIRENRLRRMAERQGLTLQKSRRRDPLALGYGTFQVCRSDVTLAGPGLTLDGVEEFLRAGPH